MKCKACNGKGYHKAYNSNDVDRLIQLSIQLCKESTNSILKKEVEELIKEIKR